MIISFGDKDTQSLFEGKLVKRYGAEMRQRMLDKLQILHAATSVNDLRSPPGNRLESLSGDRKGAYSIRVNNQWRICFEWSGDGPRNVTITDYH